MYMYIERYDAFKMKVCKIVLKCLQKQAKLKTYSEVSFTASTVEEGSVEGEQKEEEEEDVMQTAEDSPVFRSAMQFSMFNKRNKNDTLEYTPKSFFTAHKSTKTCHVNFLIILLAHYHHSASIVSSFIVTTATVAVFV